MIARVEPSVVSELNSMLYLASYEVVVSDRNNSYNVRAHWQHGSVMDVFVCVDNRSSVRVLYDASEEELAQKVLAALNKHLASDASKEEETGHLYAFVAGERSLEARSVLQIDKPLERENYAPTVREAYEKLLGELTMPSPRGRLVILHGPPGTGKTHFVRGLISEASGCVFFLLRTEDIPTMTGPTMLRHLLEVRDIAGEKPIVFVIEDADSVLATRMVDNAAGLSTLLNMTDGLYGDVFDVRVVATTNAKNLEIDKALRRKGRILRSVEIDALPIEDATRVLRRVTGDQTATASGPMLLADVYDRAR